MLPIQVSSYNDTQELFHISSTYKMTSLGPQEYYSHFKLSKSRQFIDKKVIGLQVEFLVGTRIAATNQHARMVELIFSRVLSLMSYTIVAAVAMHNHK